jgi:tetratricopeptide (TPR) repeat protein
MIKDIWKDTLSLEYRGQPLALRDELDEVTCLMVAERIDPKRFTGNIIALLQGVPFSALLLAQSQRFPPTPSIDALVPIFSEWTIRAEFRERLPIFLRPNGLPACGACPWPMWFVAGFPDVAEWFHKHLDRVYSTSDSEDEAARKLGVVMGTQDLPESAESQGDIENPQGHLRMRYCRNLIENYKRETKKPLETAFGSDFSPDNIYVGFEMLNALGEESNATLIASMTTKYYIELEKGYASRFADKTTLIATAGIVDALMYLVVHETVLPEQIVQMAKESAGAQDHFSCFVMQLVCLLLTVDCPECTPEEVKERCTADVDAINRSIRRTFLSYSGDPALSSRVRVFMTESRFSGLREAAGVAPASFGDTGDRMIGIEWETLNEEAMSLSRQGRYDRAIVVAKKALEVAEQAVAANHPAVTASLNNLAELYRNQGQYAQAEPLYKRSLAIREKALGPNHPGVASTLNNLALLYDSQGHYAQAEPLCKRSLAIREKALGPDHPDVATSLNNLGMLYYNQGQYAQAEPLYKRSLGIMEKTLGQDHPDVATSLNNLAQLYETQGQYAQAEPLFKRSLAISEKALGPDHPDVAQRLENLAALYRATNRTKEAEVLEKRAAAIRAMKR